MRKVFVFAALLAVVILSLVPQLAFAQTNMNMARYKDTPTSTPPGPGKVFVGFSSVCHASNTTSGATKLVSFEGYSQTGWLPQPWTTLNATSVELKDYWTFYGNNASINIGTGGAGATISSSGNTITSDWKQYNTKYLQNNFAGMSCYGPITAAQEGAAGSVQFPSRCYTLACWAVWQFPNTIITG